MGTPERLLTLDFFVPSDENEQAGNMMFDDAIEPGVRQRPAINVRKFLSCFASRSPSSNGLVLSDLGNGRPFF